MADEIRSPGPAWPSFGQVHGRAGKFLQILDRPDHRRIGRRSSGIATIPGRRAVRLCLGWCCLQLALMCAIQKSARDWPVTGRGVAASSAHIRRRCCYVLVLC